MCFEGIARLSRRVWRRFVRGSREISLVPSLHRASTDALIITSFWFYNYILYIKQDELAYCFPVCDFFSISVAHENIGIRELAFHFRQLAYHHQYHNLEPMSKAILLLQLSERR